MPDDQIREATRSYRKKAKIIEDLLLQEMEAIAYEIKANLKVK